MNSIRWNLSRNRFRFSKADAIVVSPPKSGRTWLRVFLCSYFCTLYQREFTLDERALKDLGAPALVFTHDLFEHATEPRLLAKLRGRHLIPPKQRRSKPILLMVRDPRDLIVSWYFQLTKRSSTRRFEGSLGDMVGHPQYGIKAIIELMNSWMCEWADRPKFKLIRYEDCRLDPAGTFGQVLQFLGVSDINQSAFDSSLQFSSFDNMKKMEIEGKFGAGILTAKDVQDSESFKVRRGIIGGYKDYLDQAVIDALEQELSLLDRRYGYGLPGYSKENPCFDSSARKESVESFQAAHRSP